MHNTPLVHVSAEGDWSADFDAMATYTILQPFPSSAWDWIGLYKVSHLHFLYLGWDVKNVTQPKNIET